MPDFSSYGAEPDTGNAPLSAIADHPANTAKSKLEVALYWASRGFPVLRLGENGKHPLDGTNGHKNATTDADRIRAWWTGPLGEDLNYNVGIRASVCPVVDLDVKDGRDGVGNYLSLGGELGGLVVRTATGGYHVYVDGPDLKGRAGDVGPGIDTRGSGGYVVAAGSTIDGRAYEVVSDKPRLACPQFVIDAVGVRGEHTTGTRTKYTIEDDRPRSILEATEFAQRHEPAVSGRWHELGFKAGCELCRLGVSLPTALDILRDHWIPRGTGFKSDEQFQRDVAGGYEDARQKGEHGSKSSEAHLLGLKDVLGDGPDLPPDDHEQAEQPAGTSEQSPRPAWRFRQMSNVDYAHIPQREWLVTDWLSPGHVTILYGDGGTGKSLLAQQLLTACATGRDWLGLPVNRRTVAVGLFCEDDPDELDRRQKAINETYGIHANDLRGLLYASGVGQDNTLVTFGSDGAGHDTEAFAALLDTAKKTEAGVIVVDTAADTFGGNENDRRQVRRYVGATLGKLAVETGAAVLLCAHPSRSGMRADMDGASTAWSNTARQRWALTRPQPSARDPNPDRAERVLSRRKSNYSEIGDEIRMRWQRGVLVPLTGLSPEEQSLRQAATDDLFLKLLDSNPTVSPSNRAGTYAPKVFSEHPSRDGRRYGEFEDSMNRLIAAGRLVQRNEGPPSKLRARLRRPSVADLGIDPAGLGDPETAFLGVSEQAGRALGFLRDMLDAGGFEVRPAGSMRPMHGMAPPDGPCVSVMAWQCACAGRMLAESLDDKTQDRAFRGALKELREAGAVVVFDKHVWLAESAPTVGEAV